MAIWSACVHVTKINKTHSPVVFEKRASPLPVYTYTGVLTSTSIAVNRIILYYCYFWFTITFFFFFRTYQHYAIIYYNVYALYPHCSPTPCATLQYKKYVFAFLVAHCFSSTDKYLTVDCYNDRVRLSCIVISRNSNIPVYIQRIVFRYSLFTCRFTCMYKRK